MTNFKLIMLENPIIVSDKKPIEGDWVIALDTNIVFRCNDYEATKPIEEFKHLYKKIIAGIEGLPLINWNSLGRKFGWIDVEKLYPTNQGGLMSMATRQEINNSLKQEGFKKAQSLNEKKFSLEDIKKAYARGWMNRLNNEKAFKSEQDELIQSLQQPKVFDIEVDEFKFATSDDLYDEDWDIFYEAFQKSKTYHDYEDIFEWSINDEKGKGLLKSFSYPKITNNSIKILRKL